MPPRRFRSQPPDATLLDEVQDTHAAHGHVAPSLPALRILMVEASPHDAERVAEALRDASRALEIERVEDAAAMRAALARGRWDAIISDWSMPSFGALAALELIEELDLDLPFIIVSGTVGEQTAVEAMRAGAHDYVPKDNLIRLPAAVEREVREAGIREERLRATRALIESEARYRRIVETTSEGVWMIDRDARTTYMNSRMAQMLGCEADRGVGRPAADFLDDEGRAALARYLQHLHTARPRQAELRLLPDGRAPIEVLLDAQPVFDAAGQCEGSLAMVIDISERKRTERDLQERMRIAALTADVAMVLPQELELDLVLARCAEALVEHLGVTFACLWTIGARRTDLVLAASAGRVPELAPLRTIQLGRSAIGRLAEAKLPHLDNDLRRGAGGDEPSFDGITAFAGQPLLVDDELVGVVAVYSQDALTEATLHGLGAIADTLAIGVQRSKVSRANVQLEAQLRHAQKMEAVGRLAGGVAHDFNNILTVIITCAELIAHDLVADDPIRQDVNEISTAAMRAAELTRRLLMFSRQQVLEPRVLDLDHVLEKVERMLQRILGEDVELTIRCDQGLGRVRADLSSLEQVIMNLAVNARDAMPTGGTLRIETADTVVDCATADLHPGVPPGAYVTFAVTDSGSGMDAETQARIFEPFFTTKPVGKGTGLGLSTVFGIVQQSQGFIRVESAVGQGSTFFVYLPRVDVDVSQAVTGLLPTPLCGDETILLVEDEDQLRMVARNILKRHGYRVIAVRDAAEAMLHCAASGEPLDLLVTDVVMPQMSGPELARRLACSRPDMKVLCMSGYTDDSIVRHGVIENQIAFLQKPFTSDTLCRKVRELLDQSRR